MRFHSWVLYDLDQVFNLVWPIHRPIILYMCKDKSMGYSPNYTGKQEGLIQHKEQLSNRLEGNCKISFSDDCREKMGIRLTATNFLVTPSGINEAANVFKVIF